MKDSNVKKLAIFTIISVFGIGLLYTISSQPNFYFVKFAVVGDGTTPQLFITCYLKTTTDKLIDGKIVETQQSKFLQTNPLFSLVDSKTGKDVSSFDVTPKIRCDLPTPVREGTKNTMSVKSADLILNVYSKNDKNTKINTHDERKIIGGLELPDNTEKKLTIFSVKPSQIGDDLPEGDYPSQQEFRISGKVELNYVVQYKDNTPITYLYKITIPEDSIRTWSDLKVTGIQSGEGGEEQIQCNDGYIEVDGKCEPKPSDGDGNNPSESGGSGSGFNEFIECIKSGEISCMTQQGFLIYWAIVFIIILVLVAVVSSGRRQ